MPAGPTRGATPRPKAVAAGEAAVSESAKAGTAGEGAKADTVQPMSVDSGAEAPIVFDGAHTSTATLASATLAAVGKEVARGSGPGFWTEFAEECFPLPVQVPEVVQVPEDAPNRPNTRSSGVGTSSLTPLLAELRSSLSTPTIPVVGSSQPATRFGAFDKVSAPKVRSSPRAKPTPRGPIHPRMALAAAAERVRLREERLGSTPGPGAYNSPLSLAAAAAASGAGSAAFRSRTERHPTVNKDVGDPGAYEPHGGATMAAMSTKSFAKSQSYGAAGFGSARSTHLFSETASKELVPGPGTYDSAAKEKADTRASSSFSSKSERGTYVPKESSDPGALNPDAGLTIGTSKDRTFSRLLRSGSGNFGAGDRFKPLLEEQQGHVGPGTYAGAQTKSTIAAEAGACLDASRRRRCPPPTLAAAVPPTRRPVRTFPPSLRPYLPSLPARHRRIGKQTWRRVQLDRPQGVCLRHCRRGSRRARSRSVHAAHSGGDGRTDVRRARCLPPAWYLAPLASRYHLSPPPAPHCCTSPPPPHHGAAAFKSKTSRLPGEAQSSGDPGAYNPHSSSGIASVASKSFSQSQVRLSPVSEAEAQARPCLRGVGVGRAWVRSHCCAGSAS